MTEEEQEYNVPLRDDIAMRTVDFNRSLDVHPSTFTQLTKKLGITLTGAKKTREIFPEDVRTILESKGYKYPRKAKVIVMMVNKGGTGKSTTTFYTSLRLASYGCRVLVIDGDSQGNLTKAFHLDELEMDLDETTPILLDVYKKEIELEGTIIEIRIPKNHHSIDMNVKNDMLDLCFFTSPVFSPHSAPFSASFFTPPRPSFSLAFSQNSGPVPKAKQVQMSGFKDSII